MADSLAKHCAADGRSFMRWKDGISEIRGFPIYCIRKAVLASDAKLADWDLRIRKTNLVFVPLVRELRSKTQRGAVAEPQPEELKARTPSPPHCRRFRERVPDSSRMIEFARALGLFREWR